MRSVIVLLCACCLAVGAMAQPDPNRPQPDPNRPQPGNERLTAERLAWGLQLLNRLTEQRPLLACTPDGLFILESGVLAKFHPTTLQRQGMVELYGQLPLPPAGADATPEAKQRYALEQGQRLLPAALLLHDRDLLIISGERFFRVDTRTMTVLARGSLVPGNAPFQAERFTSLAAIPVLELQGDQLYVLRGQQLAVVNIGDGKMLANGFLPEQMSPYFLIRQLNPNRPDALPPVNRPPEGGNPNEVVLVGVVTRHAEEGGFWTLKADNGDEYILEGDRAQQLIQTPEIVKKRVRVTGIVSQRAGVHQVGKGYLAVRVYEVLP